MATPQTGSVSSNPPIPPPSQAEVANLATRIDAGLDALEQSIKGPERDVAKLRAQATELASLISSTDKGSPARDAQGSRLATLRKDIEQLAVEQPQAFEPGSSRPIEGPPFAGAKPVQRAAVNPAELGRLAQGKKLTIDGVEFSLIPDMKGGITFKRADQPDKSIVVSSKAGLTELLSHKGRPENDPIIALFQSALEKADADYVKYAGPAGADAANPATATRLDSIEWVKSLKAGVKFEGPKTADYGSFGSGGKKNPDVAKGVASLQNGESEAGTFTNPKYSTAKDGMYGNQTAGALKPVQERLASVLRKADPKADPPKTGEPGIADADFVGSLTQYVTKADSGQLEKDELLEKFIAGSSKPVTVETPKPRPASTRPPAPPAEIQPPASKKAPPPPEPSATEAKRPPPPPAQPEAPKAQAAPPAPPPKDVGSALEGLPNQDELAKAATAPGSAYVTARPGAGKTKVLQGLKTLAGDDKFKALKDTEGGPVIQAALVKAAAPVAMIDRVAADDLKALPSDVKAAFIEAPKGNQDKFITLVAQNSGQDLPKVAGAFSSAVVVELVAHPDSEVLTALAGPLTPIGDDSAIALLKAPAQQKAAVLKLTSDPEITKLGSRTLEALVAQPDTAAFKEVTAGKLKGPELNDAAQAAYVHADAATRASMLRITEDPRLGTPAGASKSATQSQMRFRSALVVGGQPELVDKLFPKDASDPVANGLAKLTTTSRIAYAEATPERRVEIETLVRRWASTKPYSDDQLDIQDGLVNHPERFDTVYGPKLGRRSDPAKAAYASADDVSKIEQVLSNPKYDGLNDAVKDGLIIGGNPSAVDAVAKGGSVDRLPDPLKVRFAGLSPTGQQAVSGMAARPEFKTSAEHVKYALIPDGVEENITVRLATLGQLPGLYKLTQPEQIGVISAVRRFKDESESASWLASLARKDATAQATTLSGLLKKK